MFSSRDMPDSRPFPSGLIFYYLTTLIPLLGVAFGYDFLKPSVDPLSRRGDLGDAFARWDGQWYKKIAEEGYQYDPAAPSSVAFFPAFPVLGYLLRSATGLRTEVALLLVSHLSLAAAFVVLAAYLRLRFPGADDLHAWALLAFGLWPPTFFCRMAYSESLFLLEIILALYAMERRWPLLSIALIIGAATATRSVGVVLLAPLTLHIVCNSATRPHALLKLCAFPVACWGLLAYMGYQYWEFGEPLAFAQTQDNWRIAPRLPLEQKLFDLLILKSVWSIFVPDSPCYWGRHAAELNPLFSLHLANPIYWLIAVALTAFGAAKRWLSTNEVLLGAGLLLVPYVLRSHEMCMAGMARFSAVAFPFYLVVGKLLSEMRAATAAALMALSGFLLGAYAALFAAWYRFF
jgi:hypothetical protein